MSTNVTLGERIKQRRAELRLTQKALAERLNVTAQTVQNWEYGARTPSIPTLGALATALDMAAVDLFTAALADAVASTPSPEPTLTSPDTPASTERAA